MAERKPKKTDNDTPETEAETPAAEEAAAEPKPKRTRKPKAEAAEGTDATVMLATLGSEGPTGEFHDRNGRIEY